MGLIRLDKQYEKLYVVGCSFTTGFLEKDKGSWGAYLAKKLNIIMLPVSRHQIILSYHKLLICAKRMI